jgi:hypothetical protein
MEQNPFLRATSRWVIQNVSRFKWVSDVHYHVHNNLPMALQQVNLFATFPPHFSKSILTLSSIYTQKKL